MIEQAPASLSAPAADNGRDEQICSAQHDAASGVVQRLYREHCETLVARLRRRTGCVDTARELANESFARLLRLDPSKLRSIEKPEAFLHQISINLLRDWGRSKSLIERIAQKARQRPQELVDQVAVLESRDTLRRLEEALARMKPKTRDIFVAHRVEGLSYAEIAARTGLSIKGVEKQMGKAIAKIDRLLDRG